MGPRPKNDDPGKPPRKKKMPEKDSDDYKLRRERNNVAVRKSRDKSRMKAQETIDRVSFLKNENKQLEKNIELLGKELSVLRDLFINQAAQPSPTDGPSNQVNTYALVNDHEYLAPKKDDEES